MNPFRSWLGALNFLVLQWFGVRLARVVEQRTYAHGVPVSQLDIVPNDIERRMVTVGWRVLRWIVPLTGWWSDFRYFARRPTP